MRERGAGPEINISFREFEKILPDICDAKISKYPALWDPENPLCGTCVPVSIVARRIFGGKLMRADLRPFPEYRNMYWHWVNELPGGKIKDFTKPQFKKGYPAGMQFIEKAESSITRIPDVAYRSELLYKRLLKSLTK